MLVGVGVVVLVWCVDVTVGVGELVFVGVREDVRVGVWVGVAARWVFVSVSW